MTTAQSPFVASRAQPRSMLARAGAARHLYKAAMSASSSPSAPVTITIHGREVPVSAGVPGIDLARAVAAKPFADWAAGLDAELAVSRVTVQSVDMFGPRIGFLKFDAHASFRGRLVPSIVFMRGGAVSILVLLRCEGETHVLCTRQPRVPVGRAALLELPAGMLDESGQFAGVAAKELHEETGIDLDERALVDLTALAMSPSLAGSVPGVFPSAGGCDEFLRLMFHERSVTRAELEAMRGKATGNIDEGEVIVLEIVPYEQLWRVCSDMKALTSMLLYERLRDAGLLPAPADAAVAQ